MMLLDEGFQVVSVDASDKMLKHALKARWEKRKDPRYDEWGKVNTAGKYFTALVTVALLLGKSSCISQFTGL